MYRCEHCGDLSKPGQPSRRVVVETRRKTYPARSYQAGRHTINTINDKGGTGYETVREERMHPHCAKEYEEARP